MYGSKFNCALLSVLWAVLLAGCGTAPPVDQGANYYEQGSYDQAAAEWILLANEGHYVAQHNMGLLSRDGLGSTPLSLEDAATWYFKSAEQGYVPAMVSLAEVLTTLEHETIAESWLVLAARWGNTEAIEHLRQRDLPIPEVDLYTEQQQQQALAKLRATGTLLRPPIRKISTRNDMEN